MGLPPSNGGVQDTLNTPGPATAVGATGVDGATALVVLTTGADSALLPMKFVARAVNEYVVTGWRPVMTAEVAVADTVAVFPPGDAVTVYPEMAAPPLLAGGSKLTVASLFVANATFVMVGGSGTVAELLVTVMAAGTPRLRRSFVPSQSSLSEPS
jgi:hypothetical protein